MASKKRSLDYDLNGGRNAFRKMNVSDENWHTIVQDNRLNNDNAMRSFTESVDSDLPPAPMLPPLLDIAYQYPECSVEESDSMETIIEGKASCQTPTAMVDKALGETQKYPMIVPGPGHVDAEQELHKSLLQREGSSESELGAVDRILNEGGTEEISETARKLDHFREYRREYSVSSVQRPRPTTPTSWCAIESYVESCENYENDEADKSDSVSNKIWVSIPGADPINATTKSRKTSVPWSDFYGSMTTQIPTQSRNSTSGRVTPMNDYEGDILEEDPRYKSIVPPAPVMHRRSSTDWENFEKRDSEMNDAIDANEDIKTASMKIVKEFSTYREEPDQIHKFSADTEQSSTANNIPNNRSEEFAQKFSVDENVTYQNASEIDSNEAFQFDSNDVSNQQTMSDYGIQANADNDENAAQFADDFTGQVRSNSTTAVDSSNTATVNDDTVDMEQPSTDTQVFYDENGRPYYLAENGQYYYFYDDPNDTRNKFNSETNTAYYGYEATDSSNPAEGYIEDSSSYYDNEQPSLFDYNQTNPFNNESQYSANEQTEVVGTNIMADSNISYYDNLPSNEDSQYEESNIVNSSLENTATDIQHVDLSARTENLSYPYSENSSQQTNYSKFMQPLFKVPEREADPFSWEAQESTFYNCQQSPHGATDDAKSTQSNQPLETHSEDVMSPSTKRKPPPRPAAPQDTSTSTTYSKPPGIPPLPHLPPEISETASNQAAETDKEDDAWSQFKKLTERTNTAMKATEERLKELKETTTAKEIKDESYLSQIGGWQAYIPEMADKQIRSQAKLNMSNATVEKASKKKKERKSSLDATLAEQESMDKAALELAKKMAALRQDLQDWKPPSERERRVDQSDSGMEVERHGAAPIESSNEIPQVDSIANERMNDRKWKGFNDNDEVDLPPSESGFFASEAFQECTEVSERMDPFVVPTRNNQAMSPSSTECIFHDSYDPFDVRPAEEFVEYAKNKALNVNELHDDFTLFATTTDRLSAMSTPTQEGGSPCSMRPLGFEDEFHAGSGSETPSPLYDEDDSEELAEFPPKFTGDGWDLMVRYPIKKKIMGDRYWKPCFAKIYGAMLHLYNSRTDQKPLLEILLQANYSLSDTTLQAYDIYGKIHTVKLQHVLYKEKVGIRPGQITRLVEGHITKYGLPLEHSAQCTILLKFGSLNASELSSFVTIIEDILFKCTAVRDTSPTYKQDEVQIHCYDEYSAYVDKENVLSNQNARVRLFCLAFLTGSPYLEIGLNDRRRQGKEIVRRKDILPMYTERWIRFENVEFHETVEKAVFDEDQVIKITPPDGCFFEVMRFRVRPPINREKPLSVKCVMKIAGSKIDLRIKAMAAAMAEKSKGGRSTRHQIPCENIQIRFPIPEAWIYLFREERRWGVGSIHAKVRRPGKVKNLRERLMGTVQNLDESLIEAAIGEAKYEHVYRALVWRIPRLPEKHHGAYKEHLLHCRFKLSSFDLMPDAFLPTCDVEFTMPLATISNTVVRSVSVEKHEDSDRVEKFVRYVAKCNYKFEIDYIQCTDLDNDEMMDWNEQSERNVTESSEVHKPAIDQNEVNEIHGGYAIEFTDAEIGNNFRLRELAADSSSDEDEVKNKMPVIQIDMKNYGY